MRLLYYRWVAGISNKQAQSIIEYRERNGSFVNREQLRSIKGIGVVTYQNCAGFVRIIPKSRNTETDKEKVLLHKSIMFLQLFIFRKCVLLISLSIIFC